MKTGTPKYMCLENLYDRWYNELDEEKQLVGTAAHIIKQNIHRVSYDSYTYPEPTIITFTTPESL